MWPSDLALMAFRAEPLGERIWDEPVPGQCSHCGKPIARGERYDTVSCGAFFSDTRDLAAYSGVACGGCLFVRQKAVMTACSFVVITPQGLYPIAKDVHKAWLFLEPPEPPFLAVHSSATMQHLVWRTPVSLSREQFHLRRGPALMSLRPRCIRESIQIAGEIAERRRCAGAKSTVTDWLFASFDRAIREDGHGRLSPQVLAAATSAERRRLFGLSPGEIWALGHLLTSTRPLPGEPPLTVPTL